MVSLYGLVGIASDQPESGVGNAFAALNKLARRCCSAPATEDFGRRCGEGPRRRDAAVLPLGSGHWLVGPVHGSPAVSERTGMNSARPEFVLISPVSDSVIRGLTVESRRLRVAAVDHDVIPFAVNFPLAVVPLPLTVAASGADGVVKGHVVIEVYEQTVFESVFQST